jgi:hypothetical protein
VSNAPVAVLRDGLRSHEAALAWEGMAFPGRWPTRIEVLRERTPTAAVYRLIGAGPQGASVIAKRYPPGQGDAERLVYEHVLPHLSSTTPRCYGVRVEAGQGDEVTRWIFLEDVGVDRYSDRNAAHRELAGRWIARFHAEAATLLAPRQLPDGGPARYRAHLAAARARLNQRLERAGLTTANRRLIGAMTAQLDGLAVRWSAVQTACTGLPLTLAHGDFRPKNVYLRAHEGRLACFPIDWETAGWGIPVVDLTRIDLAAYWDVARKWQVGLDPGRVQGLAALGQVFRTIAAIDWESTGVGFDSPRMISRPLASLGVLLRQLRQVIGAAGLDT